MKSFDQLVRIMSRLRGPGGCPWDRKQTHASLLKYLFEESKELQQAIRKKDDVNLAEELGDILLQVVFHSEIARRQGRFSIQDVVKGLARKLILRHPHVFGYKPEHQQLLKGKSLKTEADVLANWDVLKSLSKPLLLRRKKR